MGLLTEDYVNELNRRATLTGGMPYLTRKRLYAPYLQAELEKNIAEGNRASLLALDREKMGIQQGQFEAGQALQDKIAKQQARVGGMQGLGNLAVGVPMTYLTYKSLFPSTTLTTTPTTSTGLLSTAPNYASYEGLRSATQAGLTYSPALASTPNVVAAPSATTSGLLTTPTTLSVGGATPGAGVGGAASVNVAGVGTAGTGTAGTGTAGTGTAGMSAGTAGLLAGGSILAGEYMGKQGHWMTPWGGEKTERKVGSTLGYGGAGAAIGTAIMPGIGTIIGAGIGGGVGLVKESTVICTELNRQGYISDEILVLDSQYRKENIDDITYQGYLLWAETVVKWMQKSKIITQIIRPFGVAWAYEMAHRMKPNTYKGHWLGKVMIKIGVPICRWIGGHLPKKEVAYGNIA